MHKIRRSINFLYKICKQTEKLLLPIVFISITLGAFSPLIITLFSKIIVDDIYNNNGKCAWQIIAIFLGAYFLVSSIAIILDCIVTNKKEHIIKKQYMIFAEKIMSMDLEYIDDYNISMQKEKARRVITWNSRNVDGIKNSLGGLLEGIIRIVYCSIFLSFLNFYVIFIVVLCVALRIINEFLSRKNQRILYEKSVHINQEENELNKIISNASILKKSKINKYNMYLCEKYEDNLDKKKNYSLKNYKISFHKNLFDEIINFIQKLSVYLIVVLTLFNENSNLSLGDFAFYISITILLSSSCSSFFYFLIGLNDNSKYVNDFIDFIEIPNKIKKDGTKILDLSSKYELEFVNVSFKYNNSNDYALKNINLKIKSGDLISLVGLNGSGKSTLIKLLLRLYEPIEGEILLNGINIKDIDYNTYVSMFAPVFQDYNIYNFQICENIAMKNVDNINNNDVEKINSLMKSTDLYDAVYSFNDNIHTVIGTGYYDNNVELSTGQSQKVAISRASYKSNKIAVLDEPYSNISIVDEINICNNIINNINYDIIIMISHRFNAINKMSRIIVINEGKIIENGSFNELINNKGYFYDLYMMQGKEIKNEE